MYKEIVICIIIIFLIVLGNIVTQKYTENSIKELGDSLNKIKEASDSSLAKEEINNSQKIWNERYKTLSYYIEHDELEKVTEAIIKSKSNIDTGDEGQAIENIDNCIFLLDHIKEKEKFNLRNIF